MASRPNITDTSVPDSPPPPYDPTWHPGFRTAVHVPSPAAGEVIAFNVLPPAAPTQASAASRGTSPAPREQAGSLEDLHITSPATSRGTSPVPRELAGSLGDLNQDPPQYDSVIAQIPDQRLQRHPSDNPSSHAAVVSNGYNQHHFYHREYETTPLNRNQSYEGAMSPLYGEEGNGSSSSSVTTLQPAAEGGLCELASPSQYEFIYVPKSGRADTKKFLECINGVTEGREGPAAWSVVGWGFVYLSILGMAITMWNKERLRQIKDYRWYSGEEKKAYKRYCQQWECDEGLVVVLPMVLLSVTSVVVYLCLIVEAAGSYTVSYLSKHLNVEQAVSGVRASRLRMPKVQIKVECYHIRRHEGKVVSFSKSFDMPVERCIDASGDLDGHDFHNDRMNRFEIGQKIGFLDATQQEQYDRIKKSIHEKYKGYDDGCDVKLNLEFGQFERVQTVYAGREYNPCWFMTLTTYWIFSCFLLTWPYRLLHKASTHRVKFTFLKLVQLRRIDV